MQQNKWLSTTRSINENIAQIQELTHQTEDLQVHDFHLRDQQLALMYYDTTSDIKKVDQLQQLLLDYSVLKPEILLASSASLHLSFDFNEVVNGLLAGKTALLINNEAAICMVNTSLEQHRKIQEPTKEKTIQGNHDGFIEHLQINLYLLRRSFASDDLVVKYYDLGTPKHKIAMVFRDTPAARERVNEMDKRLKAIPQEAIVNIGVIEDWIEDNRWSIFPQTIKTERPDRTTAHLFKEKIILISNNPLAVVMPVNFHEFFHTSDEYTLRWIPGTVLRFIRFLAFFLSITLPALYVSLVAFHFEVIPGDLILQVKTSLEQIPYPPIIEVLIMSLTIEFIIEAGIRMPSGLAQIIGIVGGLVIGDAVVKAGLVSNVLIIVIALTTISSFIVPSYELSSAFRVLRLPMTIIAALLGFYGMMMLLTLILIHLCHLKSLGLPYFSLQDLFSKEYVKHSILRSHVTFGYKRRSK